MKKISQHQHTLKLIASHALLVALVTEPTFIGLFTDLYTLVLDKKPDNTAFLAYSNLFASMQLLSRLALATGIIALALYFINKSKSTK